MTEVLTYLLMGMTTLVQPEIRQDMVFERGTTQWVRGPMHLFGNTVVEGGACVMFEPGTYGGLILHGPIDCRTGPGDPAFFSMPLAGDGPVSFADRPWFGLALAGTNAPYDLHDLRIRHTRHAIALYAGVTASIRHVQIQNSVTGVAWLTREPVHVGNVLMMDVTEAFRGFRPTLLAEHLTLHRVDRLQGVPSVPFRLFNSILAGVNQSDGWEGEGVWVLPDRADTFARAWGGHHYLPVTSPLREGGADDVTHPLREELQWRTTDAPVRMAGPVTGPIRLGPRDPHGGSTPTPGYHYDRVDYCLEDLRLEGGELILQPGTVVASRDIELRPGSALRSIGQPAQPVRWVDLDRVHEIPSSGARGIRMTGAPGLPAKAEFEHSILSGGGDFQVEANAPESDLRLRHSIVRESSILWTLPAQGGQGGWTNNLIECVRVQLTSLAPRSFAMCHHDLLRGGLEFRGVGSSLRFEHNVVHAFLLAADPEAALIHRANAYLEGTAPWGTPALSDWIHEGPPSFLLGPLGDRYVASSAPAMAGIPDGGQAFADAYGLYWFTTQPDDSFEGSGVADLGFHYAATQGFALRDDDRDGLPNVAEDADGNGMLSPGESRPDLADTDQDGWDDAVESRLGLSPTLAGPAWESPDLLGLKLHATLE